MNEKIEFSEYVILLDVAFMNQVVSGLKKDYEDRSQQFLPPMDIVSWLTCVALDAGIRGANNSMQVLLLHDATISQLDCCQPSLLADIDAKACQTSLGEFSFTCVNTAQLTTSADLFVDLMRLAIDSAQVKRVILLPMHATYGKRVEEELCELLKDKSKEEREKPFYFTLFEPEKNLPCMHDSVVFSLAHVLGIK